MTPSLDTPPLSITSARLRSDRVEAIKLEWTESHNPDAVAALESNPDLATDRATVLDLAYEEYCARKEAGEQVDATAFCERFPYANSLYQLINVHNFLSEHPNVLSDTPTQWPEIGKLVSDFRIVRELGRGAFSRVYLALETSAGDRPVVVKIASLGNQEAATLGPLSHFHVIQVLSSRPVGSWSVVAMPFAGTATLDDLLATAWRQNPNERHRNTGVILNAVRCGGLPEDPDFSIHTTFTLDPTLSFEDGISVIAEGLCSGLAYLHERGIAHRDLKPSNVLLGASGHPYLLDFNLATGKRDSLRLAGTIPYMSPEQLVLMLDSQANPPQDWKPADVFSIGVMLFELYTGATFPTVISDVEVT